MEVTGWLRYQMAKKYYRKLQYPEYGARTLQTDMGLGIGPREGVLLGANLGRAIVINGDFTAYVCDSAATRPSSQITFGKLVIVY